METNSTDSPTAVEEQETPVAEEAVAAETPAGEEAAGEATGEASEDKEGTGSADAEKASDGEDVRMAEFQPLSGKGPASVAENMGLIMDVTVPVTVELGSTEMNIREIMNLGPGSVVRLDRPLGEPADIMVNGELVGRGEVVVVDDLFGIRVTELISPNDDGME